MHTYHVTVRDITGIVAEFDAIGETSASTGEAVRACFETPVGVSVRPL